MPLADQKEKWWATVMDVGLGPELSKMVCVVRELPPSTPREAYLPQRLECAYKRGNNGDTKQAQ